MKENTLFKLDLLQAHYLQKPARFGVTKQMLRSEKYQSKNSSERENSKRVEKSKHKLLQLSREEAFNLIKQFQNEAFDKKVHFLQTDLHRVIFRVLKKERQRLANKLNLEEDGNKDEEKGKAKTLIDKIDSLLAKDSSLLSTNIKHKIFKVILKAFPDKVNLKESKFEGLSEPNIEFLKTMKETNPYLTNGDQLNNLLSKVYSDKAVKESLNKINTLELVWGPKKDNRENKSDMEGFEDENSEYEEVSDEDSKSDGEEKRVSKELQQADIEAIYDNYKDGLVASSDEEQEGEGDDVPYLDPNVNYNEITDEEPSEEEIDVDIDDDEEVENGDADAGDRNQKSLKKRDNEPIEEDDFFSPHEPQSKKQKNTNEGLGLKDIQLPKLATGYYSGGESDEDTRDSLVDEITAPRKNRRGQRARQKIWEKKYGSKAKHVQKEHERSKSERERLRIEYEQRAAKRAEKQKIRDMKERELQEKKVQQTEKKQTLHPSWEAKLKQKESLNAKFSGKKITFD